MFIKTLFLCLCLQPATLRRFCSATEAQLTAATRVRRHASAITPPNECPECDSLVSWAAAPCAWMLRRLEISYLLTYLLTTTRIWQRFLTCIDIQFYS